MSEFKYVDAVVPEAPQRFAARCFVPAQEWADAFDDEQAAIAQAQEWLIKHPTGQITIYRPVAQ